MPSLLDMADIPMTNILENCTYKSVLALRKVYHSLRNFIDDTRFKTDLDNISITIRPTGFSVSCLNSNAFWMDGIGFAKDWTPNDLKIILRLVQNSKLSRFSVNTNSDNVRGLNDLEELLKNQTCPLKIKHFDMEGSEILKVLPYLDSKTLKNITIAPENYETDDQNLEGIETLIELEQFKNAVELHINHCFLVRADLRKFFHFQRVSVKLHETSIEELVALKEVFVTSTQMELFDLNGRGLKENQLEQVFGSPFIDPCYPFGGSNWFFEIRNCKENVLRIELMHVVKLRFSKWEVRNIPDNAFVQQ